MHYVATFGGRGGMSVSNSGMKGNGIAEEPHCSEHAGCLSRKWASQTTGERQSRLDENCLNHDGTTQNLRRSRCFVVVYSYPGFLILQSF